MNKTKYSPEGFFGNLFGKKPPVVKKPVDNRKLDSTKTVELLMKLPSLSQEQITLSPDMSGMLRTARHTSIAPDGSMSKILKGLELTLKDLGNMADKLGKITKEYDMAYNRLMDLKLIGAKPEVIYKVGKDVETAFLKMGDIKSKMGRMDNYHLMGIDANGHPFENNKVVSITSPTLVELEHLYDLSVDPYWDVHPKYGAISCGSVLDSSDHPFRAMDTTHPLTDSIFNLTGIYDGDPLKEKQNDVFYDYKETGEYCWETIGEFIDEIIKAVAIVNDVTPVYIEVDYKKWQKAL